MRIGVAQIRLHDDLDKNLNHIKGWIQKAADEGIDILAFPETSLTGYLYEGFRRVKREDIEAAIDTLVDLTRKLKVSAVVGSPVWEEDRLFNSVVILLADGRRLLYHKNHLVDYEEEYFTPGKARLTFALGHLTFGTIVCRDQNFPELARSVREDGAQVLFISCAHYYPPMEARWKVDKNRALPIARACENQIFVCLANSIGSSRGRINLGHSIIVGPNGVIIAEAGEGREELIAFDVDPLQQWRW